MKSEINFVEGKTMKSLIKMVLPLLISMILTMMYNLVDSLWVGNLLGEMGYAALTHSTAVLLILNAIAIGAGTGVSILISQTIGAKKHKEVEGLIVTTLIISGIFALLVSVGLEIFLKPLLVAMKTQAEILNNTYTYLAIYFIGFIGFFLYMQFTSIFRSFGDPMFQMKGMLYTTILNAILDPIMIHSMGLAGAAWATVISQYLCLAYAYFYMKKKKLFKFKLSNFSVSYIRPIIMNAIPAALQSCMPAISSATMIVLVSDFGISTISAYGVTSKLEILLFYPAMAMNMAITTIVGQCKGANRLDRVKDYMKSSIILGGIFTAITSVIVILESKNLSMLFIKSTSVATIVGQFFYIVSIGYVLYMITSCFLGELSGLGKPGISMLLMFIYYIVIRVPLAIILVHTSLGLNGIWVAILISHILAAVIASLFTIFVSKKEKLVVSFE